MKHHIKKHVSKVPIAVIGTSLLHHADWTVHGILAEFTHNGFYLSIAALVILMVIDLVTKGKF